MISKLWSSKLRCVYIYFWKSRMEMCIKKKLFHRDASIIILESNLWPRNQIESWGAKRFPPCNTLPDQRAGAGPNTPQVRPPPTQSWWTRDVRKNKKTASKQRQVLSGITYFDWNVFINEFIDGEQSLWPLLVRVPRANFHWHRSASSNWSYVVQALHKSVNNFIKYIY